MDLETLELPSPTNLSPQAPVFLMLHTGKVRSRRTGGSYKATSDAQPIKPRESNLTASGTCFVIRGGIGTAVDFSGEEVWAEVSAGQGICF